MRRKLREKETQFREKELVARTEQCHSQDLTAEMHPFPFIFPGTLRFFIASYMLYYEEKHLYNPLNQIGE